MRRRTRQIMRLLGEDAVASVLTACSDEPQLESHLIKTLDFSENTLRTKIRQLEAFGLLERADLRGQRGRPRVQWRVAAKNELDTFAEHADSFAEQLGA